MQILGRGTKILSLGSALLLSYPVAMNSAYAAQSDRHDKTMTPVNYELHPRLISSRPTLAPETRPFTRRAATRSYGISCVPYAREVSGIMVVGNAWQWWTKAAGHYARGQRPEVGAVLNFRANGRMILGHVAVVTKVVNAREVVVDHSNWSDGGGRGTVSRNVAVVDVSEANNWSAVRVELANRSMFGSVYPTYGFIYNRPDTGFVAADASRPAPQPVINPVPSDLRPVAERPWRVTEEIAEAAGPTPNRINPASASLSSSR